MRVTPQNCSVGQRKNIDDVTGLLAEHFVNAGVWWTLYRPVLAFLYQCWTLHCMH